MPEKTRRSLLAAVGVGLASGCLSDSGGGPGETTTRNATTAGATTVGATTDRTATTEGTATTEETAAGARTEHAADSPEPDHSITLRSEAAESRTVRVRIVREATGETVFETTATASPGERTLYNLREADPEGVEAFRICGELAEANPTGAGDTTATATATTDPGGAESPRRDCATVRTSECYGNAHVTVEDDDSLEIIYAIC